MLKAAAISAITQSTPVQITATGHGIPNGWPVAVVGVSVMNGINATRYPPVNSDLHDATVVDANTVQLNDVSSALMTPAYAPGVSGGSLVWNTPQVLTGAVATMTIWDSPERNDTPLQILTNGSGGSGITIDAVAFTIIPFLQTAGLAWAAAGTVAYYDLDVTDATGTITNLYTGSFTVQ